MSLFVFSITIQSKWRNVVVCSALLCSSSRTDLGIWRTYVPDGKIQGRWDRTGEIDWHRYCIGSIFHISLPFFNATAGNNNLLCLNYPIFHSKWENIYFHFVFCSRFNANGKKIKRKIHIVPPKKILAGCLFVEKIHELFSLEKKCLKRKLKNWEWGE